MEERYRDGEKEENLGKIISLTRKIEARLEKLGASGSGIHSKNKDLKKLRISKTRLQLIR